VQDDPFALLRTGSAIPNNPVKINMLTGLLRRPDQEVGTPRNDRKKEHFKNVLSTK
jgi:hypothetical protein